MKDKYKTHIYKNNNGVVDAGELLTSGSFSADNANITFELNESFTIPTGSTSILLTYTF